MKRRVILEGKMPYRALNRLRREGIAVENVQISTKNSILFCVDAKDVEKIFAIYPNMCYNGSKYTVYTARVLPSVGWQKTWENLQKRIGLLLGCLLFLALTAFSDRLVLRIEVVGSTQYSSAVTEVLQKHGVLPFREYPFERSDLVTAEILRIDGVGFCSVQKVGSTLLVEVQSFPFADEKNF